MTINFMKTAKILTFCLLLPGAVWAEQVTKTTLLLDSTRIARTDNIHITVGRAVKSSANPLFGEDRPWEPRYDNMYPNVIWDEEARLYKCWYNPFLVEVEDWEGSNPTRMRWLYRQSGLCYATSEDGIHWVKPAMNLWPFNGRPSNILLRDVHGVGVFRDAHAKQPDRRYKMFYVNEKYGRRTTVAVRFSADGLRWGEPIVLDNFSIWADTHNNSFWAPTLQRYVTITRDWDFHNPGPINRVRLVARTESEDFVHWSDPEVVFRGLDDNLQIYAMPVFYYAGIYLGLPAIFNISEDRVQVELAWSKDTRNWHRVAPGVPLIPRGEKRGDFDWGCVYAAATPIIRPDGIRLYYGGSDGPHYGERRGGLGLAILGPDGFAAAEPVDRERKGAITTVSLAREALSELKVTADAGTDGDVQIVVLDDQNVEIARSEPLTGSISAHPVIWSVAPDPDGGDVKLKFILNRARLYSYQTSDGEG